MTVVNCAYIGGLTGIVKRRGRGTPTVFGRGARRRCGCSASPSWPRWRSWSRLRHLIFESMTANVNGLAAVIARIPDMEVRRRAAQRRDFATALRLLAVPVLRLVGASASRSSRLIGWWALSRVLARLLGIPDVHKLESVDRRRTGRAGTGAAARCPVPLPERPTTTRSARCR